MTGHLLCRKKRGGGVSPSGARGGSPVRASEKMLSTNKAANLRYGQDDNRWDLAQLVIPGALQRPYGAVQTRDPGATPTAPIHALIFT